MSPLTLSLTSSRLRSDAQMLHHSLSFLKEYFTYQKSRDDIIRTFLQERQMSLASPPTTSYCFLNSSMLLSNFFWSSKSLEIDSQVSTSEGNLKKQTKTLYFPQLQQQRVRGYDVSGSAREAFSGISNATLNLASLSLKSWQQGCQGSMTSVQSLPMNSSSLRKLSSSVEPKDSFEGYIKEVFFYAFIGQGYPS